MKLSASGGRICGSLDAADPIPPTSFSSRSPRYTCRLVAEINWTVFLGVRECGGLEEGGGAAAPPGIHSHRLCRKAVPSFEQSAQGACPTLWVCVCVYTGSGVRCLMTNLCCCLVCLFVCLFVCLLICLFVCLVVWFGLFVVVFN